MNLDHRDRAVFARLADVLIAAGDGMPSASDADVHGQWLDAVLAARPDLEPALKSVIHRATDHDATDFVDELAAQDPAAFGVLAEVVPAAYFMNPDVRAAIHYAGQTPQPIDPHPDYLDDGLLESVIRRGPIYRPTRRCDEQL